MHIHPLIKNSYGAEGCKIVTVVPSYKYNLGVVQEVRGQQALFCT